MSSSFFEPIAILGAGAWGTALALHLARQGQAVKLWAYEKAQVKEINTSHFNQRYLPQRLPDSIACFHEYEAVLSNVRDILLVVPSAAFRETLVAIKPLLKEEQRLFWATKGLDQQSHQLLHEVAQEIVGNRAKAVLSGPSFAKEVAEGLPTAVTIASRQEDFAHDLALRFQSENFHVQLTHDVIGVELGGAVKNILAIGVGIIEGLGYGANAKAALMTQGLAEMIELGKALGAEENTFLGLSGIGDLILTGTDNQSRNRRLGLALGQGQSLSEAQTNVSTAEGIITAKNVFYLLQHYKIKAPICLSVYQILYENKPPLHLLQDFFCETKLSSA